VCGNCVLTAGCVRGICLEGELEGLGNCMLTAFLILNGGMQRDWGRFVLRADFVLGMFKS